MLQYQPPELIHAVVECINDRKTLKALRLVCRATCVEAEPFLHGTIVLGDSIKHTLATQLRAISAKINAPGSRIAPYVRHIVVRPYASSLKLLPNTLDTLAHILAKLTNLESFHLDSVASCFAVDISCPLLGMLSSRDMFPSLKCLTWNHYDSRANEMGAVLERHKGLERLELPWVMGRLVVSQDALSWLRVLHCGIDTALSILPGRSVTHLRALLVREESIVFADGLSHIRVFSSKGNWDTTFAFAKCMPSLECVELGCNYVTEPWYIALRRLLPTLESTSPGLRYIHIAGHQTSGQSYAPLNLVEDCFNKLPSLQWVEVQHPTDMAYRIFDRWARDTSGCKVEGPTTIEFDEAWNWVDGWKGGYTTREDTVRVLC